MLRLLAASLAAALFLTSCGGTAGRTMQMPGNTLKSLGRTFGLGSSTIR